MTHWETLTGLGGSDSLAEPVSVTVGMAEEAGGGCCC